MAVSPEFSYFLESVHTGENIHDAEWIADDLKRVIDKSLTKVCGCTTDNAPVNQAAWKILEEKFPTLFCQGCVCHSLHLLVKDIFHRPENCVVETPFDHMKDFTRDCSSLVSFLRNNHVLNARLEREQDEKKDEQGKRPPHLALPVVTRWGQ